MKLICNKFGMPLEYEMVHPAEDCRPRSIQIAFSNVHNYMKTLEKLREDGMLGQGSTLILSTVGISAEDLEYMIPLIKSKGCDISIYTDAEKLLPPAVYECGTVTFRLFGMSQISYEKAVPYHYTDVINNIKSFVQTSGKAKCRINCSIEYQLFQYNMAERCAAKKLADELDVSIKMVYADFRSQKLKRDYLSGQLTTHEIIEAAKCFFFTYLDQLEQEPERFFEKFQGPEKIIIDANGNYESEWNPDGGSTIPMQDITTPDSWLAWNKRMYYRVQEHKNAATLWLWNHNIVSENKFI